MTVPVGGAPPRFSDSWQSLRATRAAAADVKRRLQTAGVRVPTSGRFDEYVRQLSLAETLDIRAIPPEFDWQRLHRAGAEVAELQLILDQLARDPEISGWQSKAHLAMKGCARPEEEDENSAAWDY